MTYSKGCKYSTWVLIDGLSERVETDLIGQPYSDGSDNNVYDLFGDDNHFPDFFPSRYLAVSGAAFTAASISA